MNIDSDYIRNLAKGFSSQEEIEREKLDVKRQWYDLTGNDKRDIQEFCRDVTAIANTVGVDGHIIIGIDEKTGDIANCPFKQCGLRDETQLHELIVRHVNLPPRFEIDQIKLEDEAKIVTVIKIPPSIDKPHVMGLYRKFNPDGTLKQEIQNYIPVRHGTAIYPANRTDIEKMIYDRKNIEPEYRIEFLAIPQQLAVNVSQKGSDEYLTLNLRFLIQNTGRKPIAISSASLLLDPTVDPTVTVKEKLQSWSGMDWSQSTPGSQTMNGFFSHNPIIVPYNSLVQLNIKFWANDLTSKNTERVVFDNSRKELSNSKKFDYTITLTSLNGNQFTSDIITVEL